MSAPGETEADDGGEDLDRVRGDRFVGDADSVAVDDDGLVTLD